jgi:hypothetical protein
MKTLIFIRENKFFFEHYDPVASFPVIGLIGDLM